jgi:Flp pilus assembly protein TadB
MPLSEHEQKMLDEMERQLFADDPRLARTFRSGGQDRRDRRRIVLGLAGVVVGLGVLVLAVSLPAIWLGVLAFLLMLAGAVFAVTSPRTRPGGKSSEGGGTDDPQQPAAGGNDFMRRLEERWEKRSGDDPRA